MGTSFESGTPAPVEGGSGRGGRALPGSELRLPPSPPAPDRTLTVERVLPSEERGLQLAPLTAGCPGAVPDPVHQAPPLRRGARALTATAVLRGFPVAPSELHGPQPSRPRADSACDKTT